jgi:sarcosine oxidase subunit gamma
MTQSLRLAPITRRSFVARALDALGAEWRLLADARVAARMVSERPHAAVVLRDLSPLPRTGFKGAETAAWLTSREITSCSVGSNQAAVQPDGTLLARLSPGEFLVLGRLDGQAGLVDSLDAAWSLDDAGLCFQVPRRDSHAWFLLSGPRTPEFFAKLCGVDLRPHKFSDGAIAQTSVARLSAIVIRDDRAGVPAFHLLADSASAAYLWDCLLDAMTEFDGSVAGLDSLGGKG